MAVDRAGLREVRDTKKHLVISTKIIQMTRHLKSVYSTVETCLLYLIVGTLELSSDLLSGCISLFSTDGITVVLQAQ